MSMGHVIKKQVLDIGVRQSEAFQVQHELSHWYWNHLRPLLERAFDELAPSDEVIQIDKLEIDLGHINPSSFLDPHWTAALEQTLVEELKKAIRDQSTAGNPISKQSPVLQAAWQWLYYIEYGLLPWNLGTIPAGWLSKVLEALATDIICIGDLRKLILSKRSALQRIIHQYDDAFITSILKVLTARQQPELQLVINEIQQLSQIGRPAPAKIFSPSLFREQCLFVLITDATRYGHRFEIDKSLVTLCRAVVKGKAIKQTDLESLSASIPLLKPALEAMLRTSSTIDDKLFAVNGTTGKPDLPVDPLEEPALQDEGKGDSGHDSLYTGMAGLVLLHPFLNILFSQLNWVEHGAFRNKACQQQAIGLLHFMATGQTTAPEYTLVMAKLLCGYPLKEPIQMDFDFSEDELEEARHLLNVVISKWEVLKRTSIEGLREGFLQRMGKLTESEPGFLLQVENGSIDILLDQLPWGISMIKLPWMKHLLRVDWR
ncbi:MAG: hypothetical protein J7578_16625 [Chitinophagaceae bacterium]|nr:hypothetical protein [Chitinophagaceae bacterium]